MEKQNSGTSPAPKSRWRIHLSTLMIVTIVAAILLWANVRRQSIKDMPAFYNSGWPMDMMFDIRSEYDYGSSNQLRWEPASVAINSAVAIVLLASVAVLSEFVIRRR